MPTPPHSCARLGITISLLSKLETEGREKGKAKETPVSLGVIRSYPGNGLSNVSGFVPVMLFSNQN
jgi:hypothetical protein